MTNSKPFIALTVVAFFIMFSLILGYAKDAYYAYAAATTQDLNANVATTSPAAVSTSASLVFASSSPTCTNRVISTAGSAIKIGFSDKQGFLPTATNGFTQPASTTVSYDAALYGCDAVRVYSYSTQTITVMETR